MSSDFGYKEPDLREGSLVVDMEDSIPLQIYGGISPEGFSLLSLLKKKSTFEWTLEYEAVFLEFKRYLSIPPILSKPEINQLLYLYFSVSDVAIASVLVLKDTRQQHPVYFVNKVLQGLEI